VNPLGLSSEDNDPSIWGTGVKRAIHTLQWYRSIYPAWGISMCMCMCEYDVIHKYRKYKRRQKRTEPRPGVIHVKKGKVFPYSFPSVGPGADPGVQAVSPQVT